MKNKQSNKNIKKDISILNTRAKSWIKPAYTLFVVAVPSFFMWFFLGKDFGTTPPLSIGFNILIALFFMTVVIIITLFLIYFKILKMSIMTFVIPILVCFMAIFLSSWLDGDNQWYRILIIIPLVFVVIPINIFVNYYERKKSFKIKIRNSLEKE